MNEKTIELELRAEILESEKDSLKHKLEQIGHLQSHTKRMSVMFFGKTEKNSLDVRVRVTNGACEVVAKTGAFHSHDRTEASQNIAPDQFLGMVRIFNQLNCETKVGERESFNYELPGDIVASIASGGAITYVELEKMSSESDLAANNLELENLAQQLSLQILDANGFYNLCQRLTDQIDWPFHGSAADYDRLAKQLGEHVK